MDFKALIKGIRSVQDTMQGKVAHAINTALTVRNWLIGCYIVEFEQNGEDRAAYGEMLLKKLEENLKTKGLDERRLREFRRFYIVYPQLSNEIMAFIPTDTQIRHLLSAKSQNQIRHLPSAELQDEDNQIDKWIVPAEKILYRLSYTHLRKIIPIENPVKRVFYEMETIKGCWSVAELERQINSLYFERSGLSQNKEALSAMANQKAVKLRPKDIINTPVSLEFLGLNQRALVTETDLEQAILDNLQNFLLEMGRGFCFEARQKRILIDDEYFFADLVFYHRILKCHIVVELKIDKFRHEYASHSICI